MSHGINGCLILIFPCIQCIQQKSPNVHQPNLTCGDIAQDPHLGMVPKEIEMVILKQMGTEPAKMVISPSKIVISHDFYGIIEIEPAKIVTLPTT